MSGQRKNGLEILQVVSFGNVNIQRNQWEKSVVSLRFVYADIALVPSPMIRVVYFYLYQRGMGNNFMKGDLCPDICHMELEGKGFSVCSFSVAFAHSNPFA